MSPQEQTALGGEAPEEGCWCAQERPAAVAAAGRGTCAGGVLLRQGEEEGTHSICQVALHLKSDNINIRINISD